MNFDATFKQRFHGNKASQIISQLEELQDEQSLEMKRQATKVWAHDMNAFDTYMLSHTTINGSVWECHETEYGMHVQPISIQAFKLLVKCIKDVN